MSSQRSGSGEPALAAWKLPVIVAAITVAIVGGFYLGGPGLGMAVGALAAASIVVIAVRNPPLGPIVPAPLGDFRRHILVVVDGALEDREAILRIAQRARTGDAEQAEAEVLVLAPARSSFLDRWCGDSRSAFERAQRDLVVSLAALLKADVRATATVGGEDVVQAVEDELRTFPATDVVLVTSRSRDEPLDSRAPAELRSRLHTDFQHLTAGPLPAGGEEADRTGSLERRASRRPAPPPGGRRVRG